MNHNRQQITHVLLIALLSTLVMLSCFALSWSCGGSESQESPESYFQKLQAIGNRADLSREGVKPFIGEKDYASDEDRIAALRDFFEANLEILEDYLGEVADLRPPTEISAAHDGYIATGTQVTQSLAEATAKMGDVKSQAELDRLLESPALDQIAIQFDNACRELQRHADDRSLSVDLSCE